MPAAIPAHSSLSFVPDPDKRRGRLPDAVRPVTRRENRGSLQEDDDQKNGNTALRRPQNDALLSQRRPKGADRGNALPFAPTKAAHGAHRSTRAERL